MSRVFAQAGGFVREAMLDATTAAALVAAMTSAAGHAAQVSRAGRQQTDLAVRRTRVVDVAERERAPIHGAMTDVAPEIARHFGFGELRAQAPVFLQYGVGDYFTAHADNTGDLRQPAHIRSRLATGVLFLNDCVTVDAGEAAEGQGIAGAAGTGFSGGALLVYRMRRPATWSDYRIEVFPRAGLFVAFPSRIVHEVRPILGGIRCSVACWFEDPADLRP